MWQTLAGVTQNGPDGRALEIISKLIRDTASARESNANNGREVILKFAREIDLPEIMECADGPQSSRVEALDRLAEKLNVGPKSPAIEAIFGFAASLIDPGAAILPELLRRHAKNMPLAGIWLGVFAGAWEPFRVLMDFGGLGKMLLKDVLVEPDVFSKSVADVSFDELERWFGESAKIPIRGTAARSISVELMLGVTAMFPLRGVSQKQSSAVRSESRQDDLFVQLETRQHSDVGTNSKPISMKELADVTDSLGRRVLEVEKQIEQLAKAIKPTPKKRATKSASKQKK